MSDLWHISIQCRAPYNGGDRQDWRSYRRFMVWPKTFKSQAEAQTFLNNCFTFKGLSGNKLSASVSRCGSTYAGYAVRCCVLCGGKLKPNEYQICCDCDFQTG